MALASRAERRSFIEASAVGRSEASNDDDGGAVVKGQQEAADVVVVGAGIVGLMAARALCIEGLRVTVIDRDEPARGASFGNAGVLAFPEILPLASPGSLKRAPQWLVDPLGPLSVRPSYALAIAPWLFRFFRASGRKPYAAALKAQAALMQLAVAEMEAAIAGAGLERFVKTTGSLDLYDSARDRKAAEPEWRLRRAAGFASQEVEGDELRAIQPGLAPQFTHGVFAPDGRQVQNPYEFADALATRLAQDGVRFVRGAVARVVPSSSGGSGPTTVVQTDDGGIFAAQSVVIAAGAWSKTLAAALGDPVPLDTERGYNTTLPRPDFDLRRHLYFNGHGFVVSPLAGGAIRVGGAVEFAGLNAAPNFARAKALLSKAQAFMPGLSAEGGKEWMGFRPSMPDSLPVIGRARSAPSVIYAFGHGHLGLTQSAGTGRLVADLIAGRTPPIDTAAYRPGRFFAKS